MHAKPPTTLGLVNVNRVIEIPRIIGVDCDDKLFAQIFASFDLTRTDFLGNALGLIQNILRKFCWQMKLADDREHVDARRRCRPEYFNDFAFGIDVARFPGLEANHDFVAKARARRYSLICVTAHVDVVHEARIIRHNVVKIPRPLQCADDRVVSTLEDSNHTPFAPSFDPVIRRIARYTRNHAVAVHGCPDIFRRDKNVRLARRFRNKKSVAGRMNR